MKRIEWKLSHIQTVRALHIYIAYMMDFPAYYGKNLDALHDLLTDLEEPVLLTVKCALHPSQEMQAYMPRLLAVLKDSAQENGNLQLQII